MMKHKLTLFAILMMALAIPQSVRAHDFYAVASSGDTLYYTITWGNNMVAVTHPGSSIFYTGYTKPTGSLSIPATVTHNGTTYSVTSIGFSAFYNCSGLTSVTIPNTVISIDIQAFSGCIGLTSIIIPNSTQYIGSSAFDGCSGLTSVTIPNSVTAIADAFNYCSGLTSIAVESGNTVYDSRESCNAIIETATNKLIVGCMSTTIPNSVTTIGRYAFAGHSNLTSVTIPNSITSIEECAFFHSGLISVTIPNSVTSISRLTFARCGSLATVTIPHSVTSIDNQAFQECGLTSVTIPNSVTLIDTQAFWGCPGLTSVTIGNSVTTISDYAFGGCGLSEIVCLASPAPLLGTNVFNNVSSSITIKIPCGSIGSYQSEWNYFNNFNEILPYALDVQSANEAFGSASITTMPDCNSHNAVIGATANSGYHFTYWQDGNTQNPRTITVTGDATYTAYFEADGGDDDCPIITSFPWNATFDEDLTCWKTVDADGDGYNWMNYQDYVVSESYSYFDGTNQGLTPDNWLISQRIQIPSSGTYTLSWTAAGLSDDYYNEHYSVYVSTTGDSPSDFTTPLFSETLNTPNAVNRSKSLENYRGQTVRIAFRHHNTNDVFVLGVGNVTISQNTQGIDDIDENGVHVYSEGHNIHVNEADGQSVTVYAIDGRTISAVTNATGCLSIPVAAAGVYIVKVGDHPARKVVVIR